MGVLLLSVSVEGEETVVIGTVTGTVTGRIALDTPITSSVFETVRVPDVTIAGLGAREVVKMVVVAVKAGTVLVHVEVTVSQRPFRFLSIVWL